VELQDRIDRASDELSRLERLRTGRKKLIDSDPTTACEKMSVAEKKQELRRLITRIDVIPVGKGGNQSCCSKAPSQASLTTDRRLTRFFERHGARRPS
jgi:hypothetical protein